MAAEPITTTQVLAVCGAAIGGLAAIAVSLISWSYKNNNADTHRRLAECEAKLAGAASKIDLVDAQRRAEVVHGDMITLKLEVATLREKVHTGEARADLTARELGEMREVLSRLTSAVAAMGAKIDILIKRRDSEPPAGV